MESTKRLFVGIELPDDCKVALTGLNPRLPGLRWLDAAQLHLTLSFLGEVNAIAQEALVENLGGVRVPPFFLPFQGLGSFSAHGEPSVVWVGVGHGHPHLFALHQRVQDAVLRSGLEADLKPFHPHVTVARAKGLSKQSLQPLLRKHRETEFGMMKVVAFTLFSSVLGTEGAQHTAELHVTL